MTPTGESGELRTPPVAAAVFGKRIAMAEAFVAILADTGISHGLIGPREAPRLWERHILNCGLLHYAIPEGESGQPVIDVGSGAGLPGLVLAIARPDLHIHLVEPLSRRTGWLSGVSAQLDLDNVTIHTARAESLWDQLSAPWVTARAVSGIVQLAQWTLPLLEPGGSLLALKGSRAHEELTESRARLLRLGAVDAAVETFGEGMVADPTIVLRVTIGDSIDRRRFRRQAPSSAGSARRRADRPKSGRTSGSSSRDRGRRTR
ncbi:16S rRNA (guanine(527)-N(7))-methyltransferase RsmG [Intrasporangium calvum]|uniref:Ribosomal RNA small subunit methyltransferase G n=1 Tax=Intrasporangium calvum TaxID=53358 RepID=A0ABT5GCX2_9MICO|nr:16S rRNA (guanine(527)-N(7))-methyltransferase RsmG [Intrasporangium calvum]MDC5696132.1 16S rRNA (guanine(527)-N(7))-methyltransferase RsmG [Intrasporangium calvum]